MESLGETLNKLDQPQEQAGQSEDVVKERNKLQAQVKELEDTATERDRLQQQVGLLQDAEKERDSLQEGIVAITKERDSLKDRIVGLERRLEARSRPDEDARKTGPEPDVEVDEDPNQASQFGAPKKIRYCGVCLKSVDKLSANVSLHPLISKSVLISATGPK